MLAALLIVAAFLIGSVLDRPPALASMGIAPPPGPAFPVVEGEPWLPEAAGPDGFAEVASNGAFTLYLDPATSRIAVRNERSGFLWRSNPAPERVAQETVRGTVLNNLQSPYILEYVTGTQIRRSQGNALDGDVAITYVRLPDGVQVTYTYPEKGLSFVLQYVLTDYGFEVRIPEAGIREDGDQRFYALYLLPYFGAVSGTEEDGYLFVPDGPGGLIHYDYERPPNVRGYEFAIYGDDPAYQKERMFAPKREAIAYPVFGLVRGTEAYAAIVKEGKEAVTVKALPSGLASSYHALGANFLFRQEYGRRVSGLSNETSRTVEEGRVRSDRRIEYVLLAGDDADYVGMAHAYRRYLIEEGLMPDPLAPVDQVPLHLAVIGGGEKRKFGRMSYETATTFAEAQAMVDGLREQGIGNIRVIVEGWQGGGRKNSDERFPIAAGMGGADGAAAFVAAMNERGIPVLFTDYIGWKDPDYTSFSMKRDGIRGIDTTVLQGRFRYDDSFRILPGRLGSFIVRPDEEIRHYKEVLDTLQEIGVNGVYYVEGPGDLLFSDYNRSQPLSRSDTRHYYEALLDYTREALGMAVVRRGNDYSLRASDWVLELPLESSYDLVVDTTVPFYPIALHGYVAYTGRPGNLRYEYEADFLKAIEYGALPYFVVTHEPSRVLKGTDYEDVYSSEFAVWKERIVAETEKFNLLASVYHQPIADHEQTAPGVYRTTYADGTKVTVDYNAMDFTVEGGGDE
jgi:hypothetical protein